MHGYGDRWWCPFLECLITDCPRRLTDEVRAKAKRWWNEYIGLKGDAPIEVPVNRPKCFKGE